MNVYKVFPIYSIMRAHHFIVLQPTMKRQHTELPIIISTKLFKFRKIVQALVYRDGECTLTLFVFSFSAEKKRQRERGGGGGVSWDMSHNVVA